MTERSPRQTRHLSFIAEFSTDIRHIQGVKNEVADALSRICVVQEALDFEELARQQVSCPDLLAMRVDESVTLDVIEVAFNGHLLRCDV